ncbi:MAG TPA: EscU/YscU/HrcU family type III secretion system export apparatus switch protein [Oligoflexia bacterium]|nr:EscU/YscU/HrcU family type III secretion system export apparatus switch protein [Oligoflexia bacterium]HMP49686.1 EscU/YscU/HrcU family type III secretion system export apparatus switch protein [Oligoflexia bacterium]
MNNKNSRFRGSRYREGTPNRSIHSNRTSALVKDTRTGSYSRVNESDPGKVAVALSYEEAYMDAPEVSIMGRERLASEILKVSRRYGVPVKKSPELAEKLSRVPTEMQIPQELYDEVAEVFLSLKKFPR